jgi:hypothetical protein
MVAEIINNIERVKTMEFFIGIALLAVFIAIMISFQHNGEKVYYTKENQTIEVIYKTGTHSSTNVHHNYLANGWVVQRIEPCYFSS